MRVGAAFLVGLVLLTGSARALAAPALDAKKPFGTEPICSATGWCFQHPSPLGGSATAGWAASPTDAWIVGSTGLLVHFDGKKWTWFEGAAGANLRAVWGSATDDVWAVGAGTDDEWERGVVLHWDGRHWIRWREYDGPVLDAVWGIGGEVWFVSREKVIARWDRRQLVKVPAPTKKALLGISGSGPRDVWLTSVDGVWQWNGARWSRPKLPGALSRRATRVLVPAPGEVWLADGEGDVLHRLPGGADQTWKLGGKDGVLGVTGQTVWFARGDTLRRWSGEDWIEETRDEPERSVWAIFGASPDDAWAVGQRGLLLRRVAGRWTAWGGARPSEEPSALWGSSDQDLWAVGWRGPLIEHWDGRAWVEHTAPETGELHAVWGSGPDDVWAVGDGIVHWDGHAWTRSPALLWFQLWHVWGSGPNDVWAAGDEGVLHWDGCRWSTSLKKHTGLFGPGWSRGPNDAGVFGNGGLWRWNGATWTRGDWPTEFRTKGVASVSDGSVWCVGEMGVISRLTAGGSWTRVEPPVRDDLVAVESRGPSAIWIVSKKGRLFRWNASAWMEQPRAMPLLWGGGLWVSPTGVPWLYAAGEVVSGPGALVSSEPRLPAPPATAVRPAPPARCARESAPPAPPTRAAPAAGASEVDLARRWLTALRDADFDELAVLTRVPFTIGGIDLETSRLRGLCGGPAQPQRLEGVRSFHGRGFTTVAHDAAELRATFACAMRDNMLLNALPSARGWDGGSEGVTGTAAMAALAKLPKALQRHREALAAFGPGATYVAATMTDNNGVTNTAALVFVRDAAGAPTVAALFVDELFEE
jgi:hypothetical protein